MSNQGPRPIIVEIANLVGMTIEPNHWSRGSTVTTEFFSDLFKAVTGRAYDSELDRKRDIAEALLIQVGRKPEDVMFSAGSTVTNDYFDALKAALAEYRTNESTGFLPSVSVPTEDEQWTVAETFGNEGKLVQVQHLRRERSRSLSLASKKLARRRHPEGLLECEICHIIPEKTHFEDIIEAHHRVPLHLLDGSARVMPSDLAMICPSCHRAVHKIAQCNMEELRGRLVRSGLIR